MAYKKYVDKDHYVKDSMGSDFFGELGSSYNLAKKISTKITEIGRASCRERV